MQIRKGDTVVVISGKDKGKVGTVLRAIPKANKVVVEGVNVQTKHAKATRTSASEIKHVEGPIDASNVMFYEKESKQGVRLGTKIENGKKLKEDQRRSRLGKEERQWQID